VEYEFCELRLLGFSEVHIHGVLGSQSAAIVLRKFVLAASDSFGIHRLHLFYGD
jgi:hypothetical protein